MHPPPLLILLLLLHLDTQHAITHPLVPQRHPPIARVAREAERIRAVRRVRDGDVGSCKRGVRGVGECDVERSEVGGGGIYIHTLQRPELREVCSDLVPHACQWLRWGVECMQADNARGFDLRGPSEILGLEECVSVTGNGLSDARLEADLAPVDGEPANRRPGVKVARIFGTEKGNVLCIRGSAAE
ncbi:hypothetical protein B0H12DRAFT_1117921 [Mycena haematopus]|nr:hypothetical protein B0H12DRAFT_1117921 [Mycena haematopus]